MDKYVTDEEKKKLRLRAQKLVNALRSETKFPLVIRYRGSLDMETKVPRNKDGSFDLDFDMLAHFNVLTADEAYKRIHWAIKNSFGAKGEFNSKENAIKVSHNEDEVIYHYDIATYKKHGNGILQKLIIKNGIFRWGKKTSSHDGD